MNDNLQSLVSTFAKEQFNTLAKFRDFYCISVFIPLFLKDRNPEDRIKEILLKRLENECKSIRGISYNAIQEHLRDIRSIVNRWKSTETNENLVIFLSNALTESFCVKKSIPFKVYLNDHFYLKFFAPNFNSANSSFTEYIKDKKLEKVLLGDINEIIKRSTKGEVKALLLEKGNDLLGELDEENDFVLPTEKNGTSLSNLAAIHTILNKGNVFILEKKNMPNPEQPISAII